jgi:hypothetical protein
MRTRLIHTVAFAALLGSWAMSFGQSAESPHTGPGKIRVKSKFGGPILSYDIDRNGTEGILAEMTQLNNGNVLSAVETFDQATGKIIAVLNKTENQDNDIVLGIFADSAAIVMHEEAGVTGGVTKRPYRMVSPLTTNKYTGLWKPPHFDQNDIIEWAAVNQETPTTAFLDLDNVDPGFANYAFSSDVAKNTYGPFVKMTQPDLEPYNFPAIAIDTKTNTAMVAQAESCTFGCNPEVALVDLVSGKADYFTGVGLGYVNGIAVDSEDGIAVTSTSHDGNIEFYDLKAQTGFTVLLPGAQGFIQSGTDVEYDSIHKLFLVGQPFGFNNDSFIQVYDPNANLIESLNFGGGGSTGLSFSYIALHPAERNGFVNTPQGLRSFTY